RGPSGPTVTRPVHQGNNDIQRNVPLFFWNWLWPKVLAIGLVLLIWQTAIWTEWKPSYILPSPGEVFSRLGHELMGDSKTDKTLWDQFRLTMTRGLTGYGLAIAIGTALGIAVVQWRTMRMAVGSLIAGMQTMPSIAWFPLAITFFGLTENAILFVVVLGAAPSIASGVITGIDEVPPPLLRAGQMIGAKGVGRYRYIVLPAAMPSYLAGLKQGWAFSWRSLLAGELLVPIGGPSSLGSALMYSRTIPNGAPWLMSLMIVILVIGMVIDGIFGLFTRRMRVKRGLTGTVSA
ncbi:MAG: ABC transporter permease, partial [Nocardioidaceae bacterium]